MDNFREEMRYEYPLTEKAVVIDIGGYVGLFSSTIFDKFGCEVWYYEPIKEFFDVAAKNFGSRKISMNNFGLGAKNETIKFFKCRDATGFTRKWPYQTEGVRIVDVAEAINYTVDLVKINIEGMEYALLERMISSGVIEDINYLQVQFHDVIPDAAVKMAELRAGLSKTHILQWSYDWVWESWKRRAV